MNDKRVKAIINLNSIRQNYRYIKSLAPDTQVIAVVKADAYGHGAVRVSHALEEEGCGIFAVASAGEGVILRDSGIKGDILIMGITPVSQLKILSEYGFIQTVNSVEYAKALSDSDVNIQVHIKVDTGMSRLGLYCHGKDDAGDAAEKVRQIHSLKGIKCEGIFTHFACSDDVSSQMTNNQYNAFIGLCEKCESLGLNLGLKHCCNSGGIINFPQMKLDAVRAGIILYGYMPDGSRNTSLNPAMRLVSRVLQVGKLKKGDTVSYGAYYTAERDMDIAVVSIGYADGFSRLLSGKVEVAIRGKRVKAVGRICMDMCMADITGAECYPGDEVEIFGGIIPADEDAAKMGTISYELLCGITGRVDREYTE